MAEPSATRFVVWLVAALVAWLASTWASGGSLDWHTQLSQLLGPLQPPVYRRVGLPGETALTNAPDTTAVVLNWSRFANVLQIASLLCSPPLDGVVASVFIWNNSPERIALEDFASTGCPGAKLQIYNSAENLYFGARFTACAQASTPFCFVQDDDYLVHPEIIHALHARISEPGAPRAIHLLPAHEHLSTALRTVRAGDVHTSFAWLGHGTMLHRAEAAEFLALMHALNASETELAMADNYYSILKNQVPEVWQDQGVELGGGTPFTVGSAGEARNAHHIRRASAYLTAILEHAVTTDADPLPYISPSEPDVPSVARAACRHARCVLATNIPLVPAGLGAPAGPWDVLDVETYRRARLANRTVEMYLGHPLSAAVDGDAGTWFESDGDAVAGEYVVLDYFEEIQATAWQLVVVVDDATRRVLEKSEVAVSADGLTWDAVVARTSCKETQIGGAGPSKTRLWRCHLEWTPDAARRAGVRSVRLLLGESQNSPWRIYEMYLAGR